MNDFHSRNGTIIPRQRVTIRQGIIENCFDFSQLVFISAPQFFPVLFGPNHHKFMEKIYQKTNNLFSHDYTWFLEVQGKIAGMILGYTGSEKSQLGLSTGFLFFKRFIKRGQIGNILFLLKIQNFFPKVERNDFYISNLAVYPEFQNRGFGTDLLQVAEHEAIRKGCTSMALDVETENLRAFQLYQKRGYVLERESSLLTLGKSTFRFLRMKKQLFP